MKKEICWNITARCNQGCKFCHRFLDIKDLSYEDNLKILSKLSKAGVTDITWTGGEALLVEGIDTLLKKASNLGIRNKIITNGKLLTKERIDKLYKYLDSITLSLDSIDNDINEDIGRGYTHYEEIKNILDYIKEKNYDVKIRINSVIGKPNMNSYIDVIKFLNNYDIYSIRLFKFMPLRELALVNRNKFDVTQEDYENIVSSVNNISNCDNIDTRTTIDMEEKYILILANGDIVVTENGKDKKIGNALSTSLEEIIK